MRYSHDALAAEFADDFDVVASSTEDHVTPWGATQQFIAVLLRAGDYGTTVNPRRASSL